MKLLIWSLLDIAEAQAVVYRIRSKAGASVGAAMRVALLLMAAVFLVGCETVHCDGCGYSGYR